MDIIEIHMYKNPHIRKDLQYCVLIQVVMGGWGVCWYGIYLEYQVPAVTWNDVLT